MKRLDFFKALGIAALSPKLLVSQKVDNVAPNFATQYFKDNPDKLVYTKPLLHKWPIYPQQNHWATGFLNGSTNEMMIETNIFTYVKINREGIDYLVPVKETRCCYPPDDIINQQFEYSVKQVQSNYEVSEWQLEKGFIIKYDKNIHH